MDFFNKFVKWIMGWIKYMFTGSTAKQIVFAVILICLSIGSLLWCYIYWQDIAKIPIVLGGFTAAILGVIMFDIIVLKEIDVNEAIKQNPLNYGMVIMGVCYIAGKALEKLL